MARAKEKERKPLHLAKLNVHKGDNVLVLAGKDRGRRGLVQRAMPRDNKVIVEGINIAKKHVRARGAIPAGIVEKPMPLWASKVMVICTECGEPTRIAHERVPMGADQKVRTRRVCKRCGKPIEEHTRS
ncbi:MAG TPA: 50S ribosomal protein L24 [Ktedonobacterales bacterium]|nr:50S ribosomal protein L24 [Ktedonobacterales bacterium]